MGVRLATAESEAKSQLFIAPLHIPTAPAQLVTPRAPDPYPLFTPTPPAPLPPWPDLSIRKAKVDCCIGQWL